jgi:hypothetical protein
MGAKESNAYSGKEAVDRLIELFWHNNPTLLSACEATLRANHPALPPDWQAQNGECKRGTQTAKVDLWVNFKGAPKPIAIAVLSADGGDSNHIERHPVDYYVKDLSFPPELVKILKLFTGTTKPCHGNASEYASDAELSKGYAYFRDLNKENQKKLLHLLLSQRDAFIDKALLGRGELIYKSKKLVGNDRIELFAFIDRKKPAGTEWSFLAPADVIKAICSQGIKPAARGDRQILLGYGLTLKRSNSTRHKGDTSMKDHLQLQISPRKILNKSTDWVKFSALSSKVTFELVQESPSAQSDAARRGLKAEKVLIQKINDREESCKWMVEECCQCTGYGNFKAHKPNNKDKPDIIIHEDAEALKAFCGISMKTFKTEVSFGHANRGTLETYVKDLGIPGEVAKTLRSYTTKDDDGQRVMLNEAPCEDQRELLKFFTQFQRHIVSHILRGKEESQLKADWMLFHEANDDNWPERVGDKQFWHLYSIQAVIDCCCSELPEINGNGNLILGLGLTLQRKGGDNGAESANDLQFKINPMVIHEALGQEIS